MYLYCNNNPVMYTDPTGEFAITALIVGAVIGAAIGFGGTVFADYADDGEVFNGSISAEGYIANTLIGGLVGAFTGGVGSSTFTLTVPTFSLMQTTTGALAFVVGSTTVAVSGSAVATAGTVGILMFAKDRYVDFLKQGMSQNQKEKFQRKIEKYKNQKVVVAQIILIRVF